MALVLCDNKSDSNIGSEQPQQLEEDLEDGEIEDDDEPVEEPSTTQPPPDNTILPPVIPQNDPLKIPKPQSEPSGNNANNNGGKNNPLLEKIDRDRPRDRSKEKRDGKHNNEGRKHNKEKDKDNKDSRYMTEAEKSILHLRRRERMEREKWNKYRKDQQSIDSQADRTGYSFVPDDFAINLEKTLASILKKDKVGSDEDKEEESSRRSSKRKKKTKESEHKNKQRKIDSPKPEEPVENEPFFNLRGNNSPEIKMDKDERLRSSPPPRSENSYDSEHSSDPNRNEEKGNNSRSRRKNRKENRKSNKNNKNKNRDRNFKRDRSRDRNSENLVDSKGICIFYLNGKCNKNDCIYSHEAVPPMKLELCKFYLMDCCAKGENCSYMHSEFPCKFYHMGLPCNMGDDCKFAHGKPLSDGLKQILFKHIETAPRDILGGFPRLSREETLNMMDAMQKNLMGVYKETNIKEEKNSKGSNDKKATLEGPIPCLFDLEVPVPMELREENNSDSKGKTTEKTGRNRPSRWQEAEHTENTANNVNFSPFSFSQDLDMRITSNGDVDMRTLPPHPLTSLPQPLPSSLTPSNETLSNAVQNSTSDVDIRLQSTFDLSTPSITTTPAQDLDQRFLGNADVDIRHLNHLVKVPPQEVPLDSKDGENLGSNLVPANLPKMQRDLYMRIQAQQRENLLREEEEVGENEGREGQDTNWYSDDDDDDDENRLTIKVDNEEKDNKEEEENNEKDYKEVKTEKMETNTNISNLEPLAPSSLKPSEMVGKLGDLSKINITADITKLLSTLSAALPTIPTPSIGEKEMQPSYPPPAVSSPRIREEDVAKSRGATTPPPIHETGRGVDPRKDPRGGAGGEPRKISNETRGDPRGSPRDPRRGGGGGKTAEKMSIYEQGGIDLEDLDLKIEGVDDVYDDKGPRPDVDLRTMGLPFKGMRNYTPATEIDASFGSHPAIHWKVKIVEIPRPDYSNLKLSINDAEKTGDPRLRKIFRLSVEEKETPTSPMASPRASTSSVVRIDPRLRKAEENVKNVDSNVMTYNQQLNTLQSSGFYQSLTSNQKLMLNQELSSRSDQSGSHDPILNSILANLNLLPGMGNPNNNNMALQNQGTNFGIALNILQTINKMNSHHQQQQQQQLHHPLHHHQQQIPMVQNGLMGNPSMLPVNAMMNALGQGVMQPGLLGAAPGIPNLPHQHQEFPGMNFPDHRSNNQNGLLGNAPQFSGFDAPPANFQSFQPPSNNNNDDFYPQDNQGFRGGNNNNQGRNERGGGFHGRNDRRRGRNNNNNFGRNQGNRNNNHQFRRNQGGGGRSNNNRPHTPP